VSDLKKMNSKDEVVNENEKDDESLLTVEHPPPGVEKFIRFPETRYENCIVMIHVLCISLTAIIAFVTGLVYMIDRTYDVHVARTFYASLIMCLLFTLSCCLRKSVQIECMNCLIHTWNNLPKQFSFLFGMFCLLFVVGFMLSFVFF
jgi:hypothetical protein